MFMDLCSTQSKSMHIDSFLIIFMYDEHLMLHFIAFTSQKALPHVTTISSDCIAMSKTMHDDKQKDGSSVNL